MPRKITLNNLVLIPQIPKSSVKQIDRDLLTEPKTDLFSYYNVLETIIKQYPNKMLFNLNEASQALGVSVEFIRKRVTEKKIKSVNLGDRKMISINELATIIYKGV